MSKEHLTYVIILIDYSRFLQKLLPFHQNIVLLSVKL